MKHIFISIITYNGHEQTVECLVSLEKLVIKDWKLHVVVIDNASKEKFTFSATPKNYALTILHQERNSGFSGGHNVGINFALKKNADYIMVLNNDTVADPELLSHLVTTLENNTKIGAVVPKIYFRKGHEFHKDRYSKADLGKVFWYAGGSMDWENIIGRHRGVDDVDHGQYDTEGKTDLLTGCCVLFPSSVLKKVGTFDERYFLYYEDADLNERIRRDGYIVYYKPQAVLWHNNAGSTGGSGSVLQDYFISRNRMLFGMRYAPLRTKIALVRESIRLIVSGREWQKRGIKDYYVRRFGKGSFGV